MINFIDDWITPDIPLKRRLCYCLMRLRYAKDYALFLVGFWRPPKAGHIPHMRKRKIIKDYARRYGVHTMVETGTYYGDMVNAMLREFDNIYSIEIYEPLYKNACLRFSRKGNIHLSYGDSGVELQRIVENLREPAIFWLDAHYSGSGTGKGDEETPILREISIILERSVHGHIILVDDASDFVGGNGYPDVETVRSLVLEKKPGYRFRVQENIISIEPMASTSPGVDKC